MVVSRRVRVCRGAAVSQLLEGASRGAAARAGCAHLSGSAVTDKHQLEGRDLLLSHGGGVFAVDGGLCVIVYCMAVKVVMPGDAMYVLVMSLLKRGDEITGVERCLQLSKSGGANVLSVVCAHGPLPQRQHPPAKNIWPCCLISFSSFTTYCLLCFDNTCIHHMPHKCHRGVSPFTFILARSEKLARHEVKTHTRLMSAASEVRLWSCSHSKHTCRAWNPSHISTVTGKSTFSASVRC